GPRRNRVGERAGKGTTAHEQHVPVQAGDMFGSAKIFVRGKAGPLIEKAVLEFALRQTNRDAERIREVGQQRFIRTAPNDRQSKIERLRAVRDERTMEQVGADELARVWL